ncbi:hypothetical protein ACLOJK_011447 [Asimina triloba]
MTLGNNMVDLTSVEEKKCLNENVEMAQWQDKEITESDIHASNELGESNRCPSLDGLVASAVSLLETIAFFMIYYEDPDLTILWKSDGETIRINVKPKPSSGTGMLSAAGLTAGVSNTRKPTALAPPPAVGGKPRSPLPPPPNDSAAAWMTSGHGPGIMGPSESVRRNTDPLSDLSQLEPGLVESLHTYALNYVVLERLDHVQCPYYEGHAE